MVEDHEWRITPVQGLLVLLVLVTFFFTVLALKQQGAISDIRANAKDISTVQDERAAAVQARAVKDHDLCVSNADFISSFRQLVVLAVKQIQATPTSGAFNATQKAAALGSYTTLLEHTKIPDCGPAPTP